MEETRRAEIREIVEHFGDQKPAQEVLSAYCERMKFEPVMTGDLEDYTVQVKYDELVTRLYPLILAEIQKISYIPEFAGANKRKEIGQANDQVRVNIVKMIEESGVTYLLVDGITKGIAKEVGQIIESAGTTAFNKAMQVLLHLAHTKFGGDFTMKHAADYTRDVFEKAAADNAKPSAPAQEQTSQAVEPEPEKKPRPKKAQSA